MSQDRSKRKLTTIFSADAAGYSRLMGKDEDATVKTITTYRKVMTDLILQYRGRVIDSPGDNLLADFDSVVDAAQCAVAVQKELQARNSALPEDRKMAFRIGINLGDVIQEGDRIYGDGVNIAARLEGLADSGGICISKTTFDQIESKLPYGYDFIGDQTVKNIDKPVGAYRILMEPRVTVAGKSDKEKPAPESRIPMPDRPSIAVLPFDNVGGDPKEEFLSVGLTELIINTLSRLPRLFVIAAQSCFSYKGRPVKVQQIAEELNVQYVLEGGVQKSGDKVRITTQLVDAMTGHNVWSERYDGELKDIFDLQDEIAIKVMNAMSAELTEGEQARCWTKSGVTNLKALEKHYQAQGLFRQHTKENYDKARPIFEEAIALDPKFIWPYVYLGYLHAGSAGFGWSESPAKSLQMAFELAQKAIAIDDSHDGPHSLLSQIYRKKHQHDKALFEAERAVALNPNASDAYIQLAFSLGNLGRWEESVLYAKESLRLSPFPGAVPFHALGRAYFMTGQYDESIATYKKALKVSSKFLIAHVYLASCYSLMGRDAEATAEVKEVLGLNFKFTIESWAKRLEYKDKADIEREIAALQKAGLPEK